MRIFLSSLSEVQRNRFILYATSQEEIASIEGGTQQAVGKRIMAIENKMKKFLKKGCKMGNFITVSERINSLTSSVNCSRTN